MKSVMWGVVIGLIGLGVFVGIKRFEQSFSSGDVNSSPSPTSAFPAHILGLVEHEEELQPITANGKKYRYFLTVVDPAKVEIGINSELSSSSADLQNRHACRILTNGGFYGKNDLPIGLVINDGSVLSQWKDNVLFNGAIGWDALRSKIEIEKDIEEDKDWAIQSGPIVWNKGKPVELKLSRDQTARRVIAGITTEGKMMLVVIVSEDSLFQGPFLKDVPSILQTIDTVSFQSAINLDGGGASAFLTPSLRLKELQPIGSYICVKS